MTDIQRNISLELSEREARYLKSLVGFIVPSGLEHAKWALELYDRLEKDIPEITEDRPWQVTEKAVKAVATDWEKFV